MKKYYELIKNYLNSLQESESNKVIEMIFNNENMVEYQDMIESDIEKKVFIIIFKTVKQFDESFYNKLQAHSFFRQYFEYQFVKKHTIYKLKNKTKIKNYSNKIDYFEKIIAHHYYHDNNDEISKALLKYENIEVLEIVEVKKAIKVKLDKNKITKSLELYDSQYQKITLKFDKKNVSCDNLIILFQLNSLYNQIKNDQDITSVRKTQLLLGDIDDFKNNQLAYLSEFFDIDDVVDSRLNSSVNDQIVKLVKRGLYIENLQDCKHQIEKRGYYRLSGYLKKINIEHNYQNHSFNQIINYYDIDTKLRCALFALLEHFEVSFKYHICNYFCERYENYEITNQRAYLNKQNFKDNGYYNDLIYRLSLVIKYNSEKNPEFAQQYGENTQDIPLWCLCEFVNLRWFIDFFQSLKQSDQLDFLQIYYKNIKLDEFIDAINKLSSLRNIVAHHTMLYKKEFDVILKKGSKNFNDVRIKDSSLFAYIICLVRLISDKSLITEFIYAINRLIEQNDPTKKILKDNYGFNNYKVILKDECGYYINK